MTPTPIKTQDRLAQMRHNIPTEDLLELMAQALERTPAGSSPPPWISREYRAVLMGRPAPTPPGS